MDDREINKVPTVGTVRSNFSSWIPHPTLSLHKEGEASAVWYSGWCLALCQLQANAPGKAPAYGAIAWATATHEENHNRVSGSWLEPEPVLDFTVIWGKGINQ